MKRIKKTSKERKLYGVIVNQRGNSVGKNGETLLFNTKDVEGNSVKVLVTNDHRVQICTQTVGDSSVEWVVENVAELKS